MDSEYGQEYVSLEQNHWWFRARRNILRQIVAAFVSRAKPPTVLEVGVGPGENLYALYPDGADIVGLEPDERLAGFARAKGPWPVYEGTIEGLPSEIEEKTYDLITMFDVLEHIEDDAAALRILARMVDAKGALILSVPAYMWLWGDHDVVNHHYRRYTKRGLIKLLEDNGFDVEYATYFNTLLLPCVAASRLAHRLRQKRHQAPASDFKQSGGWTGNILYTIFGFEARLLRLIRFPCGVSLAVVARRVGNRAFKKEAQE